jgi:transcriptional regulator with XRE-family HTH domain
MTDKIQFPDELGRHLRTHREARGLTKKALAQRANKVREVIYRLERGEDVTVSSLFAVTRALGLAVRLEPAGLPTMEEVAARFRLGDEDDEEEGDADAA